MNHIFNFHKTTYKNKKIPFILYTKLPFHRINNNNNKRAYID